MEFKGFKEVIWGVSPTGADRESVRVLIDLIENNDLRVVEVSKNSGVLEWGGCLYLTPFHLI